VVGGGGGGGWGEYVRRRPRGISERHIVWIMRARAVRRAVTERKSIKINGNRERERLSVGGSESEREKEKGRKIDGETDYYNIIDRSLFYYWVCCGSAGAGRSGVCVT